MDPTWRIVSRTVIGIGLVVIGLALACTSRRGMDPEPLPYGIYVAATDYSITPVRFLVYVYDADSLQLLDSIPIPLEAGDMAVTPDGQAVLLKSCCGSGERPLLRVNTATHEIEWMESALGSAVTLLNNGKWVINGSSVLNTVDGSVVRELPDTLHYWSGPQKGTETAATVVDIAGSYLIDTTVTVIDVATGTTRGRYVAHVSSGHSPYLSHVRLHPDGSRVLAIGWNGPYRSWFVVGDVQTGETLLEHRLVYPYGDIAISADGTTAVVTDPSRPMIWDSQETMDIFDLKPMRHLRRFLIPQDLSWASEVQFLPGDRQIVTSGYPGPLQIVDLNTNSAIDSICLPFRESLQSGLTVAPRLR
ncbi:MAG TPA: WD40 repeat domain-containing protein [Acidobacteriota bacterium]|nr:WD40 repeat domain-containing protein [Acidobacteriota bacterium]